MPDPHWADIDATGRMLQRSIVYAYHALQQAKEPNEIAQLINAITGASRAKYEMAKTSATESRLSAIEDMLKAAKSNVIST